MQTSIMDNFHRKNFKTTVVSTPYCSKVVGKFTLNLIILIAYGAKLLNADWLRQRAFFLNHEGTFGKRACIKLVSRFKRILKRNFRNASLNSEFDLNTIISS